MFIAFIFWLMSTIACCVLLFFGIRNQKYFAFCLFAACIFTALFNFEYGVVGSITYVILIDACLLVLSYICMNRSCNFWPIWFASFQFITLATHFSSWVFSIENNYFMFLFAGFWAIPALLSMAIGVILDYRSGLFREEEWKWLHEKN